jgi:hypothetical protein
MRGERGVRWDGAAAHGTAPCGAVAAATAGSGRRARARRPFIGYNWSGFTTEPCFSFSAWRPAFCSA